MAEADAYKNEIANLHDRWSRLPGQQPGQPPPLLTLEEIENMKTAMQQKGNYTPVPGVDPTIPTKVAGAYGDFSDGQVRNAAAAQGMADPGGPLDRWLALKEQYGRAADAARWARDPASDTLRNGVPLRVWQAEREWHPEVNSAVGWGLKGLSKLTPAASGTGGALQRWLMSEDEKRKVGQ